jgi:hypothetical protein
MGSRITRRNSSTRGGAPVAEEAGERGGERQSERRERPAAAAKSNAEGFAIDVQFGQGTTDKDLVDRGIAFLAGEVLAFQKNEAQGKPAPLRLKLGRDDFRTVVCSKSGDDVLVEIHAKIAEPKDDRRPNTYTVETYTVGRDGRVSHPVIVTRAIDEADRASRQLLSDQRRIRSFGVALSKSTPEGFDVFMRSLGTVMVNPYETVQQTRGVSAEKTVEGGYALSLPEGKTFASFTWTKLSRIFKSQDVKKSMEKAGFEPSDDEPLLRWKSSGDEGYVAFCRSPRKIVSVCKDGAMVLSFASAGGGAVLRKPVIYLYPERETEVRVELELVGATLVAAYPRYQSGGWAVVASPDGSLTDARTGKPYSYLFWEARRDVPYDLDVSRSFCVAGPDVEAFLERSLATLGLEGKEVNDFIVYWLPVLERNAYNLISFLEEEYTDTARLRVAPAPDTLIRVFMAFRGADAFVHTSPVPLRAVTRKGFTVLEWGGADLDEVAWVPRAPTPATTSLIL